jgi:D-glycero-alpha-D-manno-heptose-7-phosphate kinase
MIITRTPFRLPLGGGGTDLPSYYERFGGALLTSAVNKYMHINVNPLIIEKNIMLKYSKAEIVNHPDKLSHELAREALKLTKIFGSIEISSMADIPARTGMGSSGSYLVGLLKALHTLRSEVISAQDLAEEACRIEMNRLKKPVGKQDQYAAAFGGIIFMQIDKKGRVIVEHLRLSPEIVKELENDLLIFYTSINRDSSTILSEQKKSTARKDKNIIKNLHEIKEIGLEIKKAIKRGDIYALGKLFDAHWQVKKKRSTKISNPKIDHWYELAKNHGALGGKIMGAGGGGFFLFCCPGNKRGLREALRMEGLKELDWRFDFEGSKILAHF